MGYTFRKKDEMLDALRLISKERQRRTATNQGPADVAEISYGFVLKTPSGGIPAASGEDCGRAECDLYYVTNEGKRKPFMVDGQAVKRTVFNVFDGSIAGDTFITAKKTYGKLVADAENCSQ